MSHYTTLKRSQFISRDHLVSALTEMGITGVEVYDQPESFRNAWDNKKQYGEIIIRKTLNPWLFSDFGFKKNKAGCYEMIIDQMDYDKGIAGHWEDQLNQRYSYFVALDVMQKQGFSLADVATEEDETIRLVLRRMG